MVKNNPTCTCPKCKDMVMSPVCGELDRKTYANECELRQAECKLGHEIRMINGPCKGMSTSCFYVLTSRILEKKERGINKV